MKRTLPSLALLLSLAACEMMPGSRQTIKVSAEAAQVLREIGADLRSAEAELQLRCRNGSSFLGFGDDSPRCDFVVTRTSEPELDAQVVPHPFEDRPLAYRVAGGSETLTRTLYHAIGRYTETRDFQGSDERKLFLDAPSGIEIRCVATREANPQHRCWIVIAARLLD